jgi:acetyl esterase/lipase
MTVHQRMMDTELRANLTYATRDGTALAGDLYLPKGPSPFPVIVAVHGGGWVQGARTAFQNFGPYLAARGYALFAVSYRFARKGQKAFPHAVQDVLAAVQFVRGNAKELNLDPERVALLGASAGGHLAAMAALAGSQFAGAYPDDPHAETSTDVKALVGVYGIYDVLEMWQRYALDSPMANNIESFIGTPPMQDRRIYFDASPLSYATVSNNKLAVLLACGTEDDLVSKTDQTDVFLRALKQAGFFVRTCNVPGAGHYWMSDPIEEPASYSGFFAPRLVRFLSERL